MARAIAPASLEEDFVCFGDCSGSEDRSFAGNDAKIKFGQTELGVIGVFFQADLQISKASVDTGGEGQRRVDHALLLFPGTGRCFLAGSALFGCHFSFSFAQRDSRGVNLMARRLLEENRRVNKITQRRPAQFCPLAKFKATFRINSR